MGGVPELPDGRLEGDRHRSRSIVRQHGAQLDPRIAAAQASGASGRRELPGVPLPQGQKPAEPDEALRRCVGGERCFRSHQDLGQQRPGHDSAPRDPRPRTIRGCRCSGNGTPPSRT